MWGVLGILVGGITKAIGSFFGFKQKQGEVIEGAINTIGSVAQSDNQYAQAAAASITALYQNGPGIERLWRPTFMWIILGLVVARWWGYYPPYIADSEISRLYDFLEIGLIGYIPLRSVDKWMRGFQIGNVLKTFIEKGLK